MKWNKKIYLIVALFVLIIMTAACGDSKEVDESTQVKVETVPVVPETSVQEELPDYNNDAYVELNHNEPEFEEKDFAKNSYEFYSELDEAGRCGVAMANLGRDLMPTEERGKIGQVRPSGWKLVKYDNVDGKYLYNRCHLIGFQLAGENANEKNLITGTRYMNVEGMLPFENQVADYIRETGNHVLYRVTPIFEGDNLVASGVQMEAKSVEDDGKGICFNVYVYNVQPGIVIDYATGESKAKEEEKTSVVQEEIENYILNTNNKKFHYEDCNSVNQMKEKNKEVYTGTRSDLLKQGYEPCGNCNP